ncbi:cytochrome P450 [Pseudonocardia xishanensis]|uniref:Cytochrome P450 n=1 Tax=Pseudonocardia xishanensis TaxID=630995 RepID=A0ABP8RQD5_9PSEU
MTTTLPQLPFDRPGVLDIAPLYAQLRSRAPVTAVRTATGDPAWLVTGHAECRALFADPRLGRSHPDPAHAARLSGAALLGGPMGDPETEQEQHATMRTLLAPAFSARRMNRLRAHVDELVTAALDRLAAHGSPADLHELVSLPIPILVICELLGVPYADRDRFRAWSEGAGRLDDPQASQRALYALVEYVKGLVERKRAEPGEDVLTDLAAAGPEHDWRSAGLAAAVLFAGHETTVTRIDVGTVLLLHDPARWTDLAADPDRVPATVEEILRVAAPGGSGLPRYAHTDVEIAGVTLRAGDCVVLAPAAANRDPRAFTAPETFDPDRADGRAHLTFGYGPRFCIGASLARVELQAVFTALPARFPALRLDVPAEDLRLRADLLTGGLDALPVAWDRAAAVRRRGGPRGRRDRPDADR